MKKSIGISLFVVALIGAGLATTPQDGVSITGTTPFWQLHGAAPAVGEPKSLVQLRAERLSASQPVVLALR